MKLFRFAYKYLTDPDFRFLIQAGHGKYNKLSDEEYLVRIFKAKMGFDLDLKNPKTFNQKLQWLKLYNRRPEYTMMADKYRVREYIADTIGDQYLIPLLGVWDDPDEIDFDALPNQFVLKCNHNSGLGMCICKDKSKLDIRKTKKQLRKGLDQDYYLLWREWPYKDIPRKIIAEKYMTDDSGQLNDFKLFCFNGEPKVTLVCSDRFSEKGLREDFYNELWEKMSIKRPAIPVSDVSIEKPVNFEMMNILAKKLAQDMPFVRTDFYEINGKIYFGEMTFFPASGFSGFDPEVWDKMLGEWVILPENTGGGVIN